jgi:two-component system response regulator AtoC
MSCAVLVIEDDRILSKNLSTYLSRHGYEVQVASTGAEALAQVETLRPDCVLVDLMLPDMTGIEVLTRIRAQAPDTRIVMMTGSGSERVAVEAMKAGAYDYLTKPLVLKELKRLLDKVVEEEKRAGILSYYHHREADQSGLSKIIGESPGIHELKQRIRHFVEAEATLGNQELPTVLITGETGTGKELVARAFHFEGPRRDMPFVELNCAAIPAHLVEAELFGYERGAFTDAKERKIGLVEAANGGTLFLDEIGEMAPALQAKLLSLLENRRVRRIGSVHEHDVDVRIIAATNRDLEQQVREGSFRSDLYYRLRVIQIAVPPLRERGADIEVLAETFLRWHGARYGRRNLQFSAQALNKLRGYRWPGNVRELRNTVEQAVLLSVTPVIDAAHLAIGQSPSDAVAASRGEAEPGDGTSRVEIRTLNLEQNERRLIEKALSLTDGNVSQAAQLLGLSRDTLRYRLSKYRIKKS